MIIDKISKIITPQPTNECISVPLARNGLEGEPELLIDKIRCAYKKQKGRSKGSCTITIAGQNNERLSIPIAKEDDVEAIK